MKSLFILLLFLVVTSIPTSYSQGTNEIEVETSFWTGTKFFVEGQRVNQHKVRSLIKHNEDVLYQFNKGWTQHSTATVLSGIGGAFIGWPLGTAIGGGEPKWLLAGIGIGIVAISVPIYTGGGEKVKLAIDRYNNPSIGYTESVKPKHQLKLISGSEGIGMQFVF